MPGLGVESAARKCQQYHPRCNTAANGPGAKQAYAVLTEQRAARSNGDHAHQNPRMLSAC